jgi:hypothetical protein
MFSLRFPAAQLLQQWKSVDGAWGARRVPDDSMSTKRGLSSGKAAPALGLHRFGFGPIGAAIILERPDSGQIDTPNLMSSAQAAREVSDFRAARRAERKLAARLEKHASASGEASSQMAKSPGDESGTPAQKRCRSKSF